jgi:hypothetical protein
MKTERNENSFRQSPRDVAKAYRQMINTAEAMPFPVRSRILEALAKDLPARSFKRALVNSYEEAITTQDHSCASCTDRESQQQMKDAAVNAIYAFRMLDKSYKQDVIRSYERMRDDNSNSKDIRRFFELELGHYL